MSKAFIQYGFQGYPSKDGRGKIGLFDGVAKIKRRPNPDYLDAWTVDGVQANRQGNCAKLPETAWNIQDLERWIRGFPSKTKEIETQLKAAEEAEGR